MPDSSLTGWMRHGRIMAEEIARLSSQSLPVEVRDVLVKLTAAGRGVLSAMDDFNAKNGTFFGGPAFFEMGRAVAAGDAALASPQPPRDEMREAVQAFLDKLDVCQPYIDNAFVMLAIRGMEHTGPTYGEELEALRAALNSNTGGGE